MIRLATLRPKDLPSLTIHELRRVADADLKRGPTTDLPLDVSEALRHPPMTPRWYAALYLMYLNAQNSLRGKETDHEASTAAVRAELVLAEADSSDYARSQAARLRSTLEKTRSEYLRDRWGTLRFLSGVTEAMVEARFIMGDQSPVSRYDSVITEERDHWRDRAQLLAEAIAEHQRSCQAEEIDPGPADVALWAALLNP
jgi:hypothetical protein